MIDLTAHTSPKNLYNARRAYLSSILEKK